MQNQQGDLEWRDGLPVSREFDDVYFSRDSGIAEARVVFLQHNRLRERWQALERDRFTIGETGFGTGLNFLCAWQLWRECAPAHARLHFVSTELYPLSHADLTRALVLWPELAPFAQELLAQYHQLAPGWRRFSFDGGRVTLTLLLGDARETLPRLRAQVDAWFLDGFAPARNPQLWQAGLLREIARLSASGCTLATYTCAGAVRRGLAAAGFRVEKVPGFGSKREMLCAEIGAGAAPAVAEQEKRAIVIGGGIAGTATAYSLAQRGWQVTLIERHAALATEASGNPQGILYPRLSGHDIPLSRMALDGFLYTLGLLRQLLPNGHGETTADDETAYAMSASLSPNALPEGERDDVSLRELHAKGQDWDDCGLLQLAFDTRESKRCREILARALPADIVRAATAAEASALAGIELPVGGLCFPGAGWVHPPALCRALAQQPGISVSTATEALRLERTAAGWQVWGNACLAEAAVVVVCSASDSVRFSQTAHLPLQAVRGQITLLPATQASSRLKAVLCSEGYVSPARAGLHCIGATFAPDNCNLHIDPADHLQNLAMLRALAPALHQALHAESLDISRLQGRAALRCASPDYLPLTGQLLDASRMSDYAPGSRPEASGLPWLAGLYINSGHGSKGLISAPLCGEIIAAGLNHEPLPVDAKLLHALDPNRFLLREAGLKSVIGAAIG